MFEELFKNKGLERVIREQLMRNAPEVWGTLSGSLGEDVSRVAQGALSSGKGLNVAGENSRKRKKLFGFGGFDLRNFDPTNMEDLLGFLLGMMLTRRW